METIKKRAIITLVADLLESRRKKTKDKNGNFETTYLNNTPNLSDSILNGKNADASEFEEIDWKNELQD